MTSILRRIRDYRQAKEREQPWRSIHNLPAYVLSVEEMRELLHEMRLMAPPADLPTLAFSSDDELIERVNAGKWTCYGLPLRVVRS